MVFKIHFTSNRIDLAHSNNGQIVGRREKSCQIVAAPHTVHEINVFLSLNMMDVELEVNESKLATGLVSLRIVASAEYNDETWSMDITYDSLAKSNVQERMFRFTSRTKNFAQHK